MQTSSLVEVANRIACLPAADTDLRALLTELCADIRTGLGVAAVVFLTVEPESVVGSDRSAQLLGDLQQQARRGPVFEAVATGRPVYTPELGRVAPVDVAMAATQAELTNSVAVPLQSKGRILGAVQLLHGHDQALGGWQTAALRPLVDVLGARLVDLRLLSRMRMGDAGRPARPAPPPRRSAEVTAAVPVLRRPDPPPEQSSGRHASPTAAPPGRARHSGEDRNGADRNGVYRNGADRNGVYRNGAERNGVYRNGAERNGADRNGADRSEGGHASPRNGAAGPRNGVAAGHRLS